MMLSQLKKTEKVIGIKQVTKAVNRNRAEIVFLAEDADERVLEPLRNLCRTNEVPLEAVDTMHRLGKACGIEVGAAAVAVLKQGSC